MVYILWSAAWVHECMVSCGCYVQAVSDHLGVKMYIITSYEQSGVIEITPHGPVSSARILYLSFWAEVRDSAPLTLDHGAGTCLTRQSAT